MRKKVVILGGGIGGMTAAHELIERGFDVEVFEAKSVPGGKARTIYVRGTGIEGRPDLPGEHGFRFFPSFYRHIPDTMRRIPYQAYRGKPGSVHDNLVQAREYLIASAPDKNLEFLVRFPSTLTDWKDAFVTYFSAKGLNLPKEEQRFFADRLFVILSSCEERRLAEYEKIPWWDFIAADQMSSEYRLYLAKGITRSLVAMRSEHSSARTIGNILIQLLLGIYDPNAEFDRVLNGPTSEVWLAPWLEHLVRLGVRFRFGYVATGMRCEDGRITGITVRDSSGALRSVKADYYISALPVERLHGLVTEAMIKADPIFGLLGNLRVAWMNGFQFFLREDATIVDGHANYVSTPWALTSISQAQFWPGGLERYGDGKARGCLSIDISDWDANGIVFNMPASRVPTREHVKIEVQAQLRSVLRPDLASYIDDANIHTWFLDPTIVLPNPGGAVNLEPLLINTANSWRFRPEAASRIENLFLAADFVRTNTDLATMEGANEAARRAVNAILTRSGVAASPCRIWPLKEPAIFRPLREYDLLRYKLGMPHASGELPPPGSILPAGPTSRPIGEVGYWPDILPTSRIERTVSVDEAARSSPAASAR